MLISGLYSRPLFYIRNSSRCLGPSGEERSDPNEPSQEVIRLFQAVDLADQFQPLLQGCVTPFRQFGKRKRACGPLRTIKTFENNGVVEDAVFPNGSGAILIADGGAPLRTALLGDVLAGRAMENGWSGIVLHGAVYRSPRRTRHVKALSVNPWVAVKQRAGSVNLPVMFGERPSTLACLASIGDEDGILVSNRPLLLGQASDRKGEALFGKPIRIEQAERPGSFEPEDAPGAPRRASSGAGTGIMA